MRSHRFRTIAACAAVASAAFGMSLATAGQSLAKERPVAPAPGFLEAEELPPHPSSEWRAGDVTEGLPDPLPFCLDDDALREEGDSYHRTFSTDLDTGAVQVSVTARSTEEAAEVAAELEESVAECAGDWLSANPGGTASWNDYGKVDAGDGAHLYGVYVAQPNSSHNVHLFGVGRDGTTVTAIHWGQIGTLADAPVQDFRKTTITAVNRL
ncbi:hypothetical protein LHJ74_02960 [Streptomyces sp. N2-109]|uniref:Uncharacterized protein n=1 Tax=Streptomyces gossypii TaxID=2883101 RepID=A0ABT2JMG1_9ACTN|nr:hypothetical protein [Streptomyces gossypii]MCT2588903.1 hypothetical protein [Streptomyces gossypii]